MKAKLFLFYLRYRKPLILVSGAIALISTSSYSWLEYKSRSIKYNPWQVVEVTASDRFTIVRDNETKTIRLCGISAVGEEARDYLRSLVNKGDGTVQLEKRKETYEAWVMLKPDFESEIHLNTWMVEKGMARHDERNFSHCLSNEELKWAEEIARENKLGIWKR
ncbi:thermonuclease family protein [Myxosarcina sp. GI1]|uniref:thermonuclease family protein n=1 Tax=Myxosarcina sp. GI1 TaxID=1541065 RepID=UPI00068AA50D|nr:thermonuclease family protein [Myxosarcina sp. GI1]